MAAGGRHFTRVAVAQIAVHPAAFYNQRDPLEDPLWDPKSTRDTLRLTDAALPALVERMTALRGRVRATLCRQVWRKLEAIVTHCHAWKVRVLVLPEYSVPWDVLADLAKVVDDRQPRRRLEPRREGLARAPQGVRDGGVSAQAPVPPSRA